MKFQILLAWRYLWGRKLRSILTTLAIVFGIMIMFGINGFGPVFEAALIEGVTSTAHQVDLIVTHKTSGVFDESLAEIVRNTPGVAVVSPALDRSILLPAEYALETNDRPIDALIVNGWDPATSAEVIPFKPLAGRWLEPGDEHVVVVRETLTTRTGLKLGDSIRLPSAGGTSSFEIVGILPKSAALGKEGVYIPLATAQRIFNQPGQINGLGAQFEPGNDNEAIRQAVLEKLGPNYDAGALDAGGNEWDTFFQMINVILTVFGALALAMGGFIMFNTFRTAVVERKRDVGMLRAVGASRRTVIGLILIEGIIQGVIGTAVGMLAGYLLAKTLVLFLAPIWEGFLRISLGNPSFSVQTCILTIGLGLGLPLISGLLPALSASKVTPLEALRPAVGAVDWRSFSKRTAWGAGLIGLALVGLATGQAGLASLGALLFLVGLVVVGPALVYPISVTFGRLLELVFAREGRLAQGNLARQPGRAAITALTITISLAILVAWAGMTTTMTSGMMSWLDKSLRADYLLLPENLILGKGNVGAGPELAQRLRHTPGIAAITTIRQSDTQFNDTALQVIGIDPETYPGLSGLIFSAGEPEQAYAELARGRYIIANGIFAAQNNLKVGQEAVLQTAEGLQTYQLVGVGIDYLNATMATAYISQVNMDRDFHEVNDILLMANRGPEADPDGVEDALLKLVKAYPAFSLISYDSWRESQFELIVTMTYSMYGLMAIVAIPSLIALVNTLGINILERIREIGMLRAIGGTRSQIQRMIIAESLLLAAMGIATGILAGLWLGYIAVSAYNMTGFIYEYYFPYIGILLTIAVGLILGALAALFPARHAARLNIVEALHYE